MKRGFTLIELLVVIAIIGIISGAIIATLRSGISQARGANVAHALHAVNQAFVLKALDDNIDTWWDEDAFPSTNSWAAYIDNLVGSESFDEFLPLAPDYPDPTIDNNFEYAYDNDSDVFINYEPGSPECWDYALTYSGSWSGWNQLAGVNIVIYPGQHPNSDEFQNVFEYLDAVIDGSDGPYCGRMTHDAWNGHDNDQKRHHYFRYRIDYDLSPDH